MGDIRGAVVAVTSEDDRSASVRAAAARLARDERRPVVLYDWDAAGHLSEPLPTWWSGDGPGERPPGPMDAGQLEQAGRSSVARQVTELQRSGIAATAWLPRRSGATALGTWAIEEGAAVIVVPVDLDGVGTLLPAGPSDHDRATSPTSAIRVVLIDRGPSR